MVWYTTEMYVIIVAGSLPTLRPLFQKAVSTYSSFKGRSSKGYLSHDDEQKHELQKLPKKQIDDSILRTTGQTAAGSKEEILPPPGDVEGIVKTVDFTIADSVGDSNPHRSEQWEDDGFGQKRVRGDERV
ncbi:MAG: hypothetical protein Q9202_001942 [Teloschistes flavicans]